MVVVEMQPTSAVAYVVHAQREVEVGDLFRTKLMSGSLASVR